MNEELETIPEESNSVALQAIEAASLDIQISTAKKYPRAALSKIKEKMLSFACLDEDTAESCFYTLKRRDKQGNEKLIQGPSIRLAEIAASCFGNIRSGARCLSNNGKSVICQGVCHDLENNVYFSMETTRRIVTKDGKPFGDDMQIITTNAACAIAMRNAVMKTIPLALIKPVMMAAKQVAIGDVKSLATKRVKVIDRLKQMGISQDRILAAVDAPKVEDVTLEKLEILIGLGTALKDNETTIEEAFPEIGGKLHSGPKSETTPEPQKPEQTPPEAVQTTKITDLTPQQKLIGLISTPPNDFTFEELLRFLMDSGHLQDPVSSPELIPDDVSKRMLRAEKGLIEGLKKARQ